MAVEDSGLLAKGWKIEVIAADHQNKPDVGTNIGKQWIDVEKVDVFVDLASSGVGLAIANLAKEKNVVNLNSGSASSDLTGVAVLAEHHPLGLRHLDARQRHRTQGAGRKSGGDSWFFLTADYAWVFWLAIASVLFNGLAILRLRRGKQQSLNQRAVMLHLWKMLLGWIAVLVGAIFMYSTQWFWIDPLLSVGIALFVFYNAIPEYYSHLQDLSASRSRLRRYPGDCNS